ncbi:MAG: efflux RND transporter permease subunit, partial [Proteobacteria bacterium]|nr:efflux RND transporter permease subunit [Pseudomonadota bacterium]
GLDTLVSSSTQSTSKVTLNLRLGADPDRAMADVLSKINQVRNQLPKEALDPVAVKQSGNGTALMYISFNSTSMQGPQITDYLTRVVQPRLQTIDGVAQAQILGGQTFAMRIWLDPDHMSAMHVTPADVKTALAANNFATAAGEVKGDFIQTSIDAKTLLDNPRTFEKLVIAARGSTLVRLGDVARVDLGPESATSSSMFNGQKAIFVGIYSTPSANPLTVINAVRSTMPAIERQLPAGLTAAIAYDATAFIRASISEVAKTLGEAALIVIIVIFLFLGSLRATVVPIVTIPLSLVGSMIGLLALGFSINLLTLLALVLAIGLVVDDAIVVVENVHRHIEQGLSRQDAALQGAREIALPVIAMTITLAAVYAPIGFVTGLTGALFREFAFTLALAVIVSGGVALTLSPMMCSRVLDSRRARGRFAAGVDRVFHTLQQRYKRRLVSSLNWRPVTLVVLAGTIGLTALMYLTSQRELAPEEDQGILLSTIKAPQYANLDYIEHSTSDLFRGVKSLPERSFFFAINGFPDLHQAFAGILLKPWNERRRTAKDILQSLQPTFANVA